MKIVFVEPGSPGVHVYKKMALPRLGSLYLGTLLKQAGHEVRVYAEDVQPPDPKVLLEADLVGISTTTSTAPRAYQYARLLRRFGVKTVLGGPHVTFRPEEAAQHADLVALGEAENTILPLAEALAGRRSLEDVPGIAWLEDGKLHRTTPATPLSDLNELPSVDLSLLAGGLPRAFTNRIAPVMTSRGCPYNCSFCLVKEMFGRRYRFRSPERVIADLRAIADVDRCHVFFYDDNFTAHRPRTRELMERIIRAGFRFGFSAQMRIEVGKDLKLLRLMQRAGLETAYIGFESVNPHTLEAYDKRQTVEEMEEGIRGFHQAGVRLHGMFVFGSDEDTVETIHQTTRFAQRNRLESVQFLILTPLPGTRFYDEIDAQGRLLTQRWNLFDGHHVTFQPRRMSLFQLQRETLCAMRRFYSLRGSLACLLRLRLFDAAVRLYGRRTLAAWMRTHREYLQRLRSSWRDALEMLGQQTAGMLDLETRTLLPAQAPTS